MLKTLEEKMGTFKNIMVSVKGKISCPNCGTTEVAGQGISENLEEAIKEALSNLKFSAGCYVEYDGCDHIPTVEEILIIKDYGE